MQDHNLEGAMPNNVCDKFLHQIFSTEFKRAVRSTQSASSTQGGLLGLREGTRQQQPLMCIARTWEWRGISKGDTRHSTEGKDATSCQQQHEGLKETQKAGSPP